MQPHDQPLARPQLHAHPAGTHLMYTVGTWARMLVYSLAMRWAQSERRMALQPSCSDVCRRVHRGWRGWPRSRWRAQRAKGGLAVAPRDFPGVAVAQGAAPRLAKRTVHGHCARAQRLCLPATVQEHSGYACRPLCKGPEAMPAGHCARAQGLCLPATVQGHRGYACRPLRKGTEAMPAGHCARVQRLCLPATVQGHRDYACRPLCKGPEAMPASLLIHEHCCPSPCSAFLQP